MSKKFIPNGDYDFVFMAEGFARTIAQDPARFGASADDAANLTAVVGRFRAALDVARAGSRTPVQTAAKESARQAAEKAIRRIARLVRADDSLDAATKVALGMSPQRAEPRTTTVPNEPPSVSFVRAIHEARATPVHELVFSDIDGRKTKPDGATRLELFVDLIMPDEPIPAFPGANHGTRPWYLRSYTKSPVRLQPPMPRVPMRVVYWGRWADAAGNVGPFSATAVGWIEGGSHHLHMGPDLGRKRAPVLYVEKQRAGIESQPAAAVVALMEAQQAMLVPVVESPVMKELPSPEAA
ncbi:MAG: hypothetical protein QM770_10225 [Tepidisphaeraceae bacterium]